MKVNKISVSSRDINYVAGDEPHISVCRIAHKGCELVGICTADVVSGLYNIKVHAGSIAERRSHVGGAHIWRVTAELANLVVARHLFRGDTT